MELWAISRKTVQEAVRSRTPVVLLLFVLVIIPVFPFILRHDGSLEGQIQLVLNYSLMLVTVMLAIQTIYLAISSFTGEIKNKQLLLIDSKPVARWKFFIGKFVGLAALNLASLVILGSAILSGVYIAYYNGDSQEQFNIKQKILTSSQPVSPVFPENLAKQMASSDYEKMKIEHRLPEDKTAQEVMHELHETAKQRVQMIPHQYRRIFEFRDLPTYFPGGLELRLRYRFFTSNRRYHFRCNVTWEIGRTATTTQKFVQVAEEFHEISIPARMIDDDGTLYITFHNEFVDAGMFYFPQEDIEILYPKGTFAENFIRGLTLIFLVLCFLALLALFASTFLTFPVAMLFVLYMLVMGMAADFFIEFIPTGTLILAGERASIWETLSQKFVFIIFQVLPNFSEYILYENLSTGRTIEIWPIFSGLLVLVVLKGGFLALLGCFIFNRREIAKPLL